MPEIVHFILVGQFAKAEALFATDPALHFEEILFAGYDDSAVLFYSFLCYMLMLEETAERHSYASNFMVSQCHLPGGYKTALVHARRAVDLAPENTDYKSALLFFHDIPDQLVGKLEAASLAAEILAVDPTDLVALSAQTGASPLLVKHALEKGWRKEA